MNLLAQIDIDPTYESRMELKDLNRVPFDVAEEEKIYISLFGTDSTAWNKAVSKFPEKEEDRSVKIVASIVSNWTNINTNEGLPMECSFANAFNLFKRYPDILTQCDNHISKKSHYLKK